MAPELAAKFPSIKTYNVKGINDKGAYGKLDWNEFGFHGMIRTANGDFFIDPFCSNNTSDYISYYTSDFSKDPSLRLPELEVMHSSSTPLESVNKTQAAGICAGPSLRTYRLAVACTGEYAKAATGLASPTPAQVMSKVVTSVNRVDGVYETEVAVKMVLVADENLVLFTDPATDPFTGNDDSYILLGESQTVIDNIIGNANYDIGHTFSTGGGGVAYLGCVCNPNSKASGITGSPSPVGDPYDIDYVAHEMGHQFAGNHTFAAATGSCQGNGNSSTKVEPGSGVTIMGYAGICDINDIAPNSIPYFHTISFDEIMLFTTNGGGSNCPVVTATGNQAPVVTGSVTYNVPKSTAFSLTGSATDPDGDTLTYQWEEIDLGSGNWNSGNAPYFRSYNPVATPTRLFPRQSVIMSGAYTTTKGEYVPQVAKTLNFRLTARDNKMGGGGVCYAASQVKVASSGPLMVTYPNVTGISWPGGSNQTVTWAVNGTTGTPVNCANVNILISLDNGLTYTTLLANTPNDGSELITAPQVTATKSSCRIKVEAVGNIFFDLGDKNFTITVGTDIKEYSIANQVSVNAKPNPFNDDVTITIAGIEKNQTSTITIFNVIGEKVMTDIVAGNDNILKNYNLSHLNKGVYFIQVTNSKQKAVTRIIKQ
jgi:hypothetical protein